MHKPILILSLFITLRLFADGGSVSGTAQSQYGEPLWGANVYLLGTSLGASTDSAGYYNIQNIPVGKYTLTCDYIGYRSGKKSIYISAFDTDGDIESDDHDNSF